MALDPNRFRQLWQRLGGQTEPEIVFEQLCHSYAEPHRAYHNQDHIADCLSHFDAVCEFVQRPDEVEVALWFHDAIYDPRASDNEEQSAAWAESALRTNGASAELVGRVTQLIIFTKHDREPDTKDAHILLDIDLSILGREPEIFDVYDEQIRAEYDWVPEREFLLDRAKILDRFLKQASIYRTNQYRAMYEARARTNLRSAISRLSARVHSLD